MQPVTNVKVLRDVMLPNGRMATGSSAAGYQASLMEEQQVGNAAASQRSMRQY